MADETLGAALEREHREIDHGIEGFSSGAGEGRTDSLKIAMDALRRHIYLEEEFLFPPLRQAGMLPPVLVMIREHGELWRTLDTLDADLSGDPSGVSAQVACRDLVSNLEAHNSKEEPIIYPQADRVLAGPAGDELHAFIESGRMPDGWVCQAARS